LIETTKNSSGEVIMRALFSAAFAAAFLLSGPALADEAKPVDPSKPIELTAAQMDTVTAGNLQLPNGRVIFGDLAFATATNPEGDFANPAPNDFHPNFDRSQTALDATNGYNGPVVPADPFGGLGGNEGPWSAAIKSPVITICATGVGC
jgi:hypothetical protein